MSDNELEQRLSAIEGSIASLVEVLSQTSANNRANVAGLWGVLEALGGNAFVRQAVNQSLERAFSIDLGMCTNEASFTQFEKSAAVIRNAMDKAERGPGFNPCFDFSALLKHHSTDTHG